MVCEMEYVLICSWWGRTMWGHWGNLGLCNRNLVRIIWPIGNILCFWHTILFKIRRTKPLKFPKTHNEAEYYIKKAKKLTYYCIKSKSRPVLPLRELFLLLLLFSWVLVISNALFWASTLLLPKRESKNSRNSLTRWAIYQNIGSESYIFRSG